MWSSISDNKNKEELEDCACGSDSTTTASGANTPAVVVLQQQQNNFNTFDNKSTSRSNSNSSSRSSSNIIENNSNICQAKIFGGKKSIEEILRKEIDSAIETEDSGFISGPQTENLSTQVGSENQKAIEFDSTFETSCGGGGEKKTTNAVHKKLLDIAGEAAAEEEKFDSGLIESDNDEEYDEEILEKEVQQQKQQYSSVKTEQKHETAIKQAATSSSHLADSAIATVPVNAAATTANVPDSQMHLKQNVDSGMSEWFCNLSLQNTSITTSPQLQHQSASVAGTAMNNLNFSNNNSRRRSTTIATSETLQSNSNNNKQQPQQQQQQQTAAGNSTTKTATDITPSNAWEQFYQQNDDGDTPLHQACIYGYADYVAALIRMAPHPCLFNIQNDDAQTPLHLATLTAQPKIVRMLLIAGAEPTLRDRHGNTALHLACMSGEVQCVRALTIPISASEINEAHRQYGHRSNDKTQSYLSYARLPSDLEIRNYDGERCVHLAAQAGHIDVLRCLVPYGADINAREGKSGRTPLHIAIESCNEELANYLLDDCQMKLNLETATYAGLTAYQVACLLNKSQMQNMLEEHGAEPLTPPESDYDSDDETDLNDSKAYDRFGDPGYFNNYNGCNPMTVA